MKFAVRNKETDRLVVSENYYFVIRQDGELDLSDFTYEV